MGTREKRGFSIWLVEKSSGGLRRGVESKQGENSCAGLTIRENFKSFGRGNKSPECCQKEKKKKNACSFFRLIKTLDVRRDLNYRFISISIIYSEICFATRPIERKRNGEDLLRSGRLS